MDSILRKGQPLPFQKGQNNALSVLSHRVNSHRCSSEGLYLSTKGFLSSKTNNLLHNPKRNSIFMRTKTHPWEFPSFLWLLYPCISVLLVHSSTLTVWRVLLRSQCYAICWLFCCIMSCLTVKYALTWKIINIFHNFMFSRCFAALSVRFSHSVISTVGCLRIRWDHSYFRIR